MDHYASYNNYSSRSDEQEEQLYCTGPQDPEDIVCEGSETEQTVAEVSEKRRRYEEVARRYLCGHRPLIQSASLRGPLSQESGWINPWRQRPRTDADWWQPGSEDMLFTRDNVLRRAADHGLGYLSPAAALAWCKAAAETEARKDIDQFDSMEAVQYSEESDSDNRGEELLSGSFPQAQPTMEIEHEVQPNNSFDHAPPQNHTAKAQFKSINIHGSKDGRMRGSKRPAGLQWLKGSYVSKRARWEEPPLSSPTPMPQQPSDRDQRRRQGSATSSGSETRRLKFISQPTTPWSHDAQRRGPLSRYNGSTAQEPKSKDDGGQYFKLEGVLDDLHQDYRDTTLVSAPDFRPGSQVNPKRVLGTYHPCSKIEPDDLLAISVKVTSSNAPAVNSGTLVSQSSCSQSNKSPKLPRSFDKGVDVLLADEDSFITEVAPSSRNLEKFQFRKKRPKHKQQPFPDNIEERDKEPKLVTGSASAEVADDSLSPVVSVTIDSVQKVPLESLARGFSPISEESDGTNKQFGLAISSENELAPVQHGVSPGSRKTDDSYLRKVATMSVNILPNLQITSPFSMFGHFTSSGVSPSLSAPNIRSTNQSAIIELEDGVQGSPSNRLNEIQPDSAPAASLLPESSGPATNNSNLIVYAESSPERRELPLDSAAKSEDHVLPDDHREVLEASRPDHDALPVEKSASQDIDELVEAHEYQMQSFSNLPTKSQATSKDDGRNAVHTQEISIDDDSTQSFNSTAPKILQKSHTSPAVACDDVTRIYAAELSDESKDQVLRIQEQVGIDDVDGDLLKVNNPEDAVSSTGEMQDEMEIIQNALSQNCRGFSSNNSNHSDKDDSSQLSISAAITEPDPATTTPVGHDDEARAVPADREQDSWVGCGPQSPWAAENILPEAPSDTNQPSNAFVTATEREEYMFIGSSPAHTSDEGGSCWQPIERPATPDNDGIIPFKKFMTPTPSPERRKPRTNLDDNEIANTQQLIEAATTNPWTSNSKKRSSRKSKKRVSFDCLLSEDRPESQLGTSVSSEQQRSASPPPPPEPQVPDRAGEEDSFDDETTVLNKFKKHFSAAAHFKHRLPKNNGLLLSSPAVGAMAERFIAADGEISLEQGHIGISESATRHLQPKSDAMTNWSPETTADDLEVNLDGFLSDAGSFLEDWSVDSEVKKINESRGKRDSRSNSSTRRRLFGMTSIWS